MKRIRFSSYEDYVEAQRQTVARKGTGPYFTDAEMDRIAEWCKDHGLEVKTGICHGARNGLEAEELMKRLPGSTIFGTDLFPHSGRSRLVPTKAKVVEWDFNKKNRRWMGRFDLVYSNSFDHAFNPRWTLRVWFGQLREGGALFLQWTKWNLGVRQGDCLGGQLTEFVDLVNKFGKVVDLLYVNVARERENLLRRKGLEAVVIVARKQ